MDDLDLILELAAAFYAEEGFTTSRDDLRQNLLVLLADDSARTVVAELDHHLAAFAITTTSFGLESGRIAELEDLYVAPRARRRGLAGLIIEDSASWAQAKSCHHLEVVVAPQGADVSHLRAFYRARGFEDDGRRLLTRRIDPVDRRLTPRRSTEG